MPFGVRRAAPVDEYDVLETADGESYILHGPNGRSVLSESGTGMPEIEYITQRGPYQDGESVRDFFLRPRVVEYHIRQNACSRAALWQLRSSLLNVLRPNRNNQRPGEATLTKVLADGTRRALKVCIQSGPQFQPRRADRWDEWSIDEVLRFIAYNPIYYNPSQMAVSFNALGGLTFPITFPIVFAASGGDVSIDYQGTWDEFPVFIITGPLDAVSIYNATTNERIGFSYSIPAGRQVTIDLTYGRKTVTYDDGTNLIGYITSSSDLGSFHLAAKQVNDISVTGTGFAVGSAITLTYYERYIGI